MAYTTIDKPTDYFNTKLYTGTGSELALTGVNFQPDLTWIKNRDTTDSHQLVDSVRGATKNLFSNLTNAEATDAQGLKSFDTDGFTVGTRLGMNTSGESYVGWNWLASNTTASNTDGSITSTVSASTTAGFSIVKYSGNSTSGATIGHGLGSTPKMIIIKRLSNANSWITYHSTLGATKMIFIDLTNAPTTSSSPFNDTSPTSSVFTVDGVGGYTPVNLSGDDYIAYCFAEKKAFSKFGSYVANGSTDGSYINLGFKPSFILIKGTAATRSWNITDNKRFSFNNGNKVLFPDSSGAEYSGYDMDLLSNGFKIRGTESSINYSGDTYIYMAFAESPFVNSNGIPNNAR
jgi:hypothetical protein